MSERREAGERFFFNDTATAEIYTLSLHDALPIYRTRGPRAATAITTTIPPAAPRRRRPRRAAWARRPRVARRPTRTARRDRKSTRLNSSHANISYAAFCL